MALDISTLGLETPPRSFDYDWQTTVQYALGIGATQGELEYLYEGHGPKVFPTFAVIPTFPVVKELFDKTGGDPKLLVHGGQSITLHRAIPPQARLQTTAKIVGVYDLKRFAQVIIRTTTTLEGNPCFDTEWSMIFRDQGGFGGPRPSNKPLPKSQRRPPRHGSHANGQRQNKRCSIGCQEISIRSTRTQNSPRRLASLAGQFCTDFAHSDSSPVPFFPSFQRANTSNWRRFACNFVNPFGPANLSKRRATSWTPTRWD